MLTRRLVRGLSVLAALAVFLTACSQVPAPASAPASTGSKEPESAQAKWEQTLQGARKEGAVVVVTHTNLLYRDLVEAFKSKYPDIAVEHVSIRPSEFGPKVVTEQQNGQFNYDLWLSPTSTMTEVAVPAGAMEPIPPYLILPEVTEPSNWRGGKILYGTKEPLILLNRGNLSGDVWVNREILPESEFNNIDQLADAKYRGKIMIRTPNGQHGGSLPLTGWLRAKGDDWIWNLLKEQDPVYIENARLLTQNLINGKYPLAVGTDQATIDNCKTAGGCQQLVYVRGYEHMLGQGAAVLKKAPHPQATSIFLNWFLTKEGQEAFKKGIVDTEPNAESAHSVRADVEPHPDALALGTVPDYSRLDKYSLQGMEQGAEEMQKVMEMYRKVEAGEPR
jgi:ABC-type Fe3+ transport system substrate-binding protein